MAAIQFRPNDHVVGAGAHTASDGSGGFGEQRRHTPVEYPKGLVHGRADHDGDDDALGADLSNGDTQRGVYAGGWGQGIYRLAHENILGRDTTIVR